jgi:hypothetical protein
VSGRAAESSGRMQAETEASRYSEGYGRKYTSSGRMMLGLSGIRTVWHVIRTDGTMDRWVSRRDGRVVRTADREPILLTCTQCRFSEALLNSGIPVKKHLYKQVILSNQNEANYNLTPRTDQVPGGLGVFPSGLCTLLPYP